MPVTACVHKVKPSVFSTRLLLLIGLAAPLALPLLSEHTLVTQHVFGDDDRFAVVDTANKVEACILTVKDPSRGKDLKQRTYVEGRYKEMPEEVRSLVIWKLINDKNYSWNEALGCMPTYYARMRFTSGEKKVKVDLCSAGIVRVFDQGKIVGGGYMQKGGDWIFQALATQFPKDRVIRKLKKQREQREHNRLLIEMAIARDERKKAKSVEVLSSSREPIR